MANEIQGSSQEVPQSLKTAEKKPLDGRIRFATMAEAVAEAYEGATFYVAELKEWYKFKPNAQGVLVAMADSSIDASQFALKVDLNGLATSVLASAQNDGLMKAADYLKLSNIDPTRITKVRASATNGKLLINDVETTVYTRENTPEDRPVTDTEKETWNGKAEALHYHATLYAPLNHNHNTLYAPLTHEHQVWDNTLGRYREKYVLADAAGSGGNATTLGGLALNNNATGVGADDAVWSASKVIATVDAKANEIALGNSWKPAVATFADIATTYPNPVDGWTVPVKDIDHSWRWNGTEWVDLGGVMPMASQSVDGKMSAIDKTKLDGIAEGANKYVHPEQHLASIIQEETDKRFMTDAERAKLTGVAANANNYTHPANHAASMITEEADKRFMTDAERAKLTGVAANANNYTHPANHAASMITEEADKRFLTDAEKAILANGVAIAKIDIATSINQILTSGLYRLAENADIPVGCEYGLLIVVRGGSTIYQQISDFSGIKLMWRSGNPSTTGGVGYWSPWRTIYHSGNATLIKATVSATAPASPSLGDIWIKP